MKRGWLYILFWSLLAMVLSISGCSSGQPAKSTDHEDVNNIEQVLKNQFTGPDEEMLDKVGDPGDSSVVGKDGETKPVPKNKQLEEYMKKKYGKYFTESMYEKFIQLYALNYQVDLEEGNYSIELTDSDIQQDEENENQFHFSADVLLKTEQESYSAKVTGRADVDDRHKIDRFNYFDDGGLNRKITELIN
ncbi:hypothetical protein [Halobacillus massiliensis]|uniref:hypothetical protein n=1 Tax=Halobacillus massiliensis TaxID=1926286 RepID=UPI0009E4055A|nr:hypothetical protein [Halobacillus massiliensis]